jgi:hypothetical protein
MTVADARSEPGWSTAWCPLISSLLHEVLPPGRPTQPTWCTTSDGGPLENASPSR